MRPGRHDRSQTAPDLLPSLERSTPAELLEEYNASGRDLAADVSALRQMALSVHSPGLRAILALGASAGHVRLAAGLAGDAMVVCARDEAELRVALRSHMHSELVGVALYEGSDSGLDRLLKVAEQLRPTMRRLVIQSAERLNLDASLFAAQVAESERRPVVSVLVLGPLPSSLEHQIALAMEGRALVHVVRPGETLPPDPSSFRVVIDIGMDERASLRVRRRARPAMWISLDGPRRVSAQRAFSLQVPPWEVMALSRITMSILAVA